MPPFEPIDPEEKERLDRILGAAQWVWCEECGGHHHVNYHKRDRHKDD